MSDILKAMDLLPERIDRECVEHAAVHVVRQLSFAEVAHVVIQPGDMTRYPIKVIRPTTEATVPIFSSGETVPDRTKSRDFWVILEGWGAMAWGGWFTTPDYVADKMRLDNAHTAKVLAGFLSLVSAHLRGGG